MQLESNSLVVRVRRHQLQWYGGAGGTQGGAAAETFGTLQTDRGPFACVGVLMFQGASTLLKTLSALDASIGLLASVET